MKGFSSFFHTTLVKGTLLLTACALCSRFLGFFFRILLSNLLGAEGMGIYQLSFPVFGIGYSLCCGGLETAISRFTAESEQEGKEMHKILFTGLAMALSLSLLCSFFFYSFADFIAVKLLGEPRTLPLVRILALAIPFSTIHGCINGHFLGKKQAFFPGISQLSEQIIRIATVLVFFLFCEKNAFPFSPSYAIAGVLTSEMAVSALYILLLKKQQILPCFAKEKLRPLVVMAAPLTANRLSLTLLSSVEAILIPKSLLLYGLSTEESLATYGILTGMALPFLLFPCTLTGSAATLLLPEIATAAATKNRKKIQKATGITVAFCMIFGLFCTFFFFLLGKPLGNLVFGNETVGCYLQTLSFLSPFLFLSAMLGSILNGLGLTGKVFTHNLLGMGLRLCFTLFLIPLYGIEAALWGLLAEKALIACLHFCRIFSQTSDVNHPRLS